MTGPRLWQRVLQRLLYRLYLARTRVLLLLVLGVGALVYFAWRGSLVQEAAAAGVFPVEVAVQPIQIQNSGLTLTLKEKNGSRRISMQIGGAEAMVIARERGPRVPGEAPKAYDLLRDTIQQMGGRVDRAVVNDANASEYFAQVVLTVQTTEGTETKVITAKPGDAVALALKAGAPVFVEDKVLEQYGTRSAR